LQNSTERPFAAIQLHLKANQVRPFIFELPDRLLPGTFPLPSLAFLSAAGFSVLVRNAVFGRVGNFLPEVWILANSFRPFDGRIEFIRVKSKAWRSAC
jgi:hypothetical protein